MRLRFEIYFSYYREKRFSSVNHTTKTIHHHKSRNCIDLISTISSRSFFSTETCFEGLSDCHKIVLSTFKTIFFKTGTKEMMYRDFKISKTLIKKFLVKSFAQAYPQTRYLNKHAQLIKKVF